MSECKYCRNWADLNNTANSNFQLLVRQYDDGPRIFIGFDDGEWSADDYSYVINYCPMCGRKLVDDEKGSDSVSKFIEYAEGRFVRIDNIFIINIYSGIFYPKDDSTNWIDIDDDCIDNFKRLVDKK